MKAHTWTYLYSFQTLATIYVASATRAFTTRWGRPQMPRGAGGGGRASLKRRLRPNEVEAMVAAYLGGMTMRELATAFGIHRLTVSAHLRQHGVPIRGRGLDEELIPEVARLYEAGCSSWTLSEKYGVTPNTILMGAILATGSVSGELLGEPSAELRAKLAGSVRLFTPFRSM